MGNFPEFKRMLEDPRMIAFFDAHGLDLKDADFFFHMLCEASMSDEVEVTSFVDGCLKSRGYAQSLDVIQILFEMRLNQRTNSNFQHVFAKKLDMLTSRIDVFDV